jgi:hypothetical protein
MERTLMRALPHDDQKGRTLYHYTDATGFRGIVGERRLWATHFRHLNDLAELCEGERLVEDEAKKLIAHLSTDGEKWLIEHFVLNHDLLKLSRIADVFVASLSENGDHLPQWRGYGARTAGYSLGFTKFRLPGIDENPPNAALALFFVKCMYDEDDYRARTRHELTDVAKSFDRFMATHLRKPEDVTPLTKAAVRIAMRRVAALVPRYKLSAFRDEHEWRLVALPMRGHEREVIKFRTSGSTVVPYIAIDLCEDNERIALSSVIVGPTVEPGAGENGARMLLRHHEYDPEMVTRSKIPFRG